MMQMILLEKFYLIVYIYFILIFLFVLQVQPPNNANRLPTPSPPPTPPTERAARLRHCGNAWDTEPRPGMYPSSVVREDVCGDSGEHIEIHPPEVVVETTVHHPHLISEVRRCPFHLLNFIINDVYR